MAERTSLPRSLERSCEESTRRERLDCGVAEKQEEKKKSAIRPHTLPYVAAVRLYTLLQMGIRVEYSFSSVIGILLLLFFWNKGKTQNMCVHVNSVVHFPWHRLRKREVLFHVD